MWSLQRGLLGGGDAPILVPTLSHVSAHDVGFHWRAEQVKGITVFVAVWGEYF